MRARAKEENQNYKRHKIKQIQKLPVLTHLEVSLGSSELHYKLHYKLHLPIEMPNAISQWKSQEADGLRL